MSKSPLTASRAASTTVAEPSRAPLDQGAATAASDSPVAPPTLTATVAICTYSRPQLLRETLRCLVRQDYPRELFEIVVIDNNSPDKMTLAVVESYAHAPVAPRYVHEPRQGLSHARNRAVNDSFRDVIVYVDDDVLVEPEWLRALLRPLEDDPEQRIAIVGGEVVPVFTEGVAASSFSFSPLRLRATCGPLKPGQLPMGANLAFRRQALIDVGQFDPKVGRAGKLLLAGDENRPVERLRVKGREVWFVPAARAFHQIPRSRTTLRYVLRHGFDSARSRVLTQMGLLEDEHRSPVPFLLSRLSVNTLKTVLFSVQFLFFSVLLQKSAAVPALVRVWRSCGYIRQTATVLGWRMSAARQRIRRFRTRPVVVGADPVVPRR
jgi:glucosyl-dolichyl phosphate glucuronosyltransferase